MRLSRAAWAATALFVLVCALAGYMVVAKISQRVEAVAFVTGALCVWLVVKDHIWNWPIGLVNSAASVVVFWQAKLYGDGVLNVIYFVLGVYGWYWWLYGGEDKSKLTILKSPRGETMAVIAVSVVATGGLTAWLAHVHDAAPFIDAATTVFSLAAQYLLTRKYVENWLFWIAVDIVYVPLYWWRGLYLMAVLYAVFLGMAVTGYIEWRRKFEARGTDDVPPADGPLS
ncbi:MAG: nicotinamide mononucleotide transporter [Armatimonadetes bacterium]|nr:nicotinamide mononucleotide transporter [Armatimonadota bacterium]